MATIDIKLKSYDELQFEIIRLITDKYLLEQKVKQYKKVIDKIKEYIKNGNLRTGEMANLYAEKYILELLEKIE